jgi:hypothetical protein
VYNELVALSPKRWLWALEEITPIMICIQALSPEAEQSELEADHLPPSSAKFNLYDMRIMDLNPCTKALPTVF